MKGLQYDLSIPKYVMTKVYNTVKKKQMPNIYPSLQYQENLAEVKLNTKNWVKLKSLMSGICGSDMNMLRGHESFSMEPYASFPMVMGHENVSEIVELGDGVEGFEIGDRVIVNPAMGCKVHERETECEFCEQGLDALCNYFGDDDGLGTGMSLGYHKATGGGWAEYYQAHKSMIYKVDKDIPLERAVLADPFCSSLQPVAEHAAGKKEKKRVFIYGAGTIGLLTVAAIRGLELPWEITVGYRYDFQGDFAKKLGADYVIKTGKNFWKDYANHFGGKIRKVSIGKPVMEGGADTIFDCVGSTATIDDSLRMAKTRGTVVLIATGSSLDKVDPTPLWFREITLVGTCMSRDVIDPRDGQQKACYALAAELFKNIELEELTTHKFAIKEYKEALNTAMSKQAGPVVKVVFDLSL